MNGKWLVASNNMRTDKIAHLWTTDQACTDILCDRLSVSWVFCDWHEAGEDVARCPQCAAKLEELNGNLH